jgi:histidine triad (HIT) family protein
MENCIFCKIAAGEIPSTKVYEDEAVYAFRDISPAAPVHVLVIPKTHYANVLEAAKEPGVLERVMQAATAIAKQEGLDETGFRLVANTGDAAGQSVKHLHVHILGGRDMSWPPG